MCPTKNAPHEKSTWEKLSNPVRKGRRQEWNRFREDENETREQKRRAAEHPFIFGGGKNIYKQVAATEKGLG